MIIIHMGGAILNANKRIDSREVVRRFLDDVKHLLMSPEFDRHQDFYIKLIKHNEDPLDPFTTQNTVIELEFDSADVIDVILSLELDHYLETVIDDKPNETLPFFAFIKTIEQREVYIKIKLRSGLRSTVFCVSFHFARYPIKTKRPNQRQKEEPWKTTD